MSLRSEVVRIINEILGNSKKISELPDADALAGSEYVEVVQDGVNKKATVSQVSVGASNPWQGPWSFPGDAYPTATQGGQIWFSDAAYDVGGELIDINTLLISKAAGTGSSNFIKNI